MVVAKTDRAHRALSEAFADHGLAGDLERAYVALVWGAPERNVGIIERRSAARPTASAAPSCRRAAATPAMP